MTKIHGSLLAGVAAVAVVTLVIISRPSDPPSSTTSPPDFSARHRAVGVPAHTARKLMRPQADALRSRLADLPAPVESPYLAGSAENADWIEMRTDELDDLAWFDDAESLRKIHAELLNPLPEIRAAALASVVAFGSRDSVPILEAIAGRPRDPFEAKALGEALEYLQLPTVIERLEQDAATLPEN